MKIKDFTTGVQHIGIPTNDINQRWNMEPSTTLLLM